jgi:rhodanese-related sulfurtransferase
MNDAVEWIDPQDAGAMIDRGEAVVVDVREPAEIAMTGIVPGALTIPMGEFADKADPESPDHDPALQPDKPIILYCASGKRSEAAGKYLLSLGYSKVFNLGGLKDWENAGLPVDEAG